MAHTKHNVISPKSHMHVQHNTHATDTPQTPNPTKSKAMDVPAQCRCKFVWRFVMREYVRANTYTEITCARCVCVVAPRTVIVAVVVGVAVDHQKVERETKAICAHMKRTASTRQNANSIKPPSVQMQRYSQRLTVRKATSNSDTPHTHKIEAMAFKVRHTSIQSDISKNAQRSKKSSKYSNNFISVPL